MASTKNIAITIVVLVMTILFFGFSEVDIWVQSQFYDSISHRWVVDHQNQLVRFIFYDGIKRILIIVAALLLLATIGLWKRPSFAPYKKGMIAVLLSAIFVPVIVGSLKAITNMPCPKNIETFGGVYPRTCVWEKYRTQECNLKKQKCWPAGHASGGFALLSLVFLFRTRRNKIIAAVSAMIIGWSMGTYKMLIGDHFLSHTVITMILAWLIILLIVRLVDSSRWSTAFVYKNKGRSFDWINSYQDTLRRVRRVE